MRLSEYLSRHGLKPSKFAAEIESPPSVITRFLKGERGVSLATALRIERATGGKVRVADLLERKAS